MSSFLCKSGCDCGENYVGETWRNTKSIMNKSIRIKSVPAKREATTGGVL